ncbi:hypothetical protein [Pseudomonas sp. LS-2]|uniref:hypothetical protein n=1 Tax=Pseudomonas sp. LS-2 TaxID=2315859 RepID=UPI0014054A57|nr:hypothetical protein [Pseudomonas sp. LS-2]
MPRNKACVERLRQYFSGKRGQLRQWTVTFIRDIAATIKTAQECDGVSLSA